MINTSPSDEYLQRVSNVASIKQLVEFRNKVQDKEALSEMSVKDYTIMDSIIFILCHEYELPTFDLKAVSTEQILETIDTLLEHLLRELINKLIMVPQGILSSIHICPKNYETLFTTYANQALTVVESKTGMLVTFGNQKLISTQTDSATEFTTLLRELVTDSDNLIGDCNTLLVRKRLALEEIISASKNIAPESWVSGLLTKLDIATELSASITTPFKTVHIDEGDVEIHTASTSNKITYRNDLSVDVIRVLSLTHISRDRLVSFYNSLIRHNKSLLVLGESLLGLRNNSTIDFGDVINILLRLYDYSDKVYTLTNTIGNLACETNLVTMEFIKQITEE